MNEPHIHPLPRRAKQKRPLTIIIGAVVTAIVLATIIWSLFYLPSMCLDTLHAPPGSGGTAAPNLTK